MFLSRKRLLTVTLAAALLGSPALASTQAPGTAGGGFAHAPVMQLATLPRRLRVRRRQRRAKARLSALPAGYRMYGAASRLRARRERVEPQLPPRDSYPRGPPLAVA